MSKQAGNKMHIFKKIFWALMATDMIGLVLVIVALFPIFQRLSGYGSLMLGVAIVLLVMAVAVLLFEILAKLFLVRSTSPAFSWAGGRKGYTAVAKLLLVFNAVAVLVGLLSAGGEGATLLNQARIYLQILFSVVEIVTAFCYLRTVRKIVAENVQNIAV